MRSALTAILLVLAVSVTAEEQKPAHLLLSAYIRFGMTQTIEQRVQAMGKEASSITAAQLSTVTGQWKQERFTEIRSELVSAYGEAAPQEFSKFIASYTEAESKNDAAYLAKLVGRITGQKRITQYNELREHMSENYLKEFSKGCVDLMSNIEAWITMTEDNLVVPPLHIWLSRDERTEKPAEKTSSADRLRNAEAVSDMDPAVLEKKSESLLSQYEGAKDKRNKTKLARAQASMAQLAKERKSYEDAYAKKTLARATADAEGMKRQARKIADAEKDAMKQYQNSWSMKFKRLIGATVGATSNAFFGGIGARAGAEAAKLLF